MADTYAELQAEITEMLVRDDMADMAPKFIDRAEQRFNRALRVPDMEDVVTSSVSSGTVTLPTDFLAMRSVYLDTSPQVVLEQMSLAGLRAKYSSVAGQPVAFALQGKTEMVFGPTPADDYPAVLNYYAAIPALSDANTSNWLLAAHSDLYLFASLFEGFAYLRDEGWMKFWEARTSAVLAEVANQGRRRMSSTPLRIRASIVE